MHDDIVRELAVATAVSIPQDEVAFAVLHIGFINDFKKYYRSRIEERLRSGEKNAPIILDELINYCITALPRLVKDCKSLYFLTTPQKKQEIKARFITESVPSMITTLAKRDLIRASVRQFLHRQDSKGNHAQIDSTKLDSVFLDFINVFRTNSAGQFRFEGTFVEYVMHCFAHYYYPNKNRDIWMSLRAVDHAKRETETGIGGIKMLTATKVEDLKIHDLLVNIVALNDLMFYHSGQSLGAKGISYDVYYLVLNYLCSEQVKRLNEDLEDEGVQDYTVTFVDELNRKKDRWVYQCVNGERKQVYLDANKSIASKVTNAWELVPYLFECIRSGNWTLDNLVEIRDQCYELGKRDMEGKNCIWKEIHKNSMTSRFYDIPVTGVNNRAFDILFKGVLSIYTLMTALEERGYYLVDTYPIIEKVLMNKTLMRSIGYISDLFRVDQIEKLQQEAKKIGPSKGDLHDFNGMLFEYAGSSQNGRGNIKENRYNAELYGFFDRPKLKQKGYFQTVFDQMNSVSSLMASLPVSYNDYVLTLFEEQRLDFSYGPPAILGINMVIPGKYNNLYRNIYFTSNPELSNYYLYHLSIDGAGHKDLESLGWTIGRTAMPCVKYRELVEVNGEASLIEYYALYVGIVGKFVMIPFNPAETSFQSLSAMTEDDLYVDISNKFFDGKPHADICRALLTLPEQTFVPMLDNSSVTWDSLSNALDNSLGFNCLMGFSNITAPNILQALGTQKLYHKYAYSITQYVGWLGDICTLQNSFVEILEQMLAYAVYTARSSDGISSRDKEYGATLFRSLLSAEFDSESLNWFLSRLQHTLEVEGDILRVKYTWGEPLPTPGKLQFDKADMSVLPIILGTKELDEQEDGTLIGNLVKVLKGKSDPATRFVLTYNYINTKLSFLRVLRDSYTMLFSEITGDIPTLICEMDSRFHIAETIESSKLGAGSGGILESRCGLLDTLSVEDVMQFVGECRQHNWQTFSVLCEDLLSYLGSCQKSITSLVDYEVAHSDTAHSNFLEYGSAFQAIGPYTHESVLVTLRPIRAKVRTDDAGFILMKNSYLKGVFRSKEYYIHSTGRILEVENSQVKPLAFDFENDRDRQFYKEIIDNALQRSSW